jgi:hypothetical protein
MFSTQYGTKVWILIWVQHYFLFGVVFIGMWKGWIFSIRIAISIIWTKKRVPLLLATSCYLRAILNKQKFQPLFSCMPGSPNHISLIHCMFIYENKGDSSIQTSVIDVKFKVHLYLLTHTHTHSLSLSLCVCVFVCARVFFFYSKWHAWNALQPFSIMHMRWCKL